MAEDNEKSPERLSSDSLRLNTPSITQYARQIILDLLETYRELETPANPELLKLHIDVATDKLDAYTTNKIIEARIDEAQYISDMFPTSPDIPQDAIIEHIAELKALNHRKDD